MTDACPCIAQSFLGLHPWQNCPECRGTGRKIPLVTPANVLRDYEAIPEDCRGEVALVCLEGVRYLAMLQALCREAGGRYVLGQKDRLHPLGRLTQIAFLATSDLLSLRGRSCHVALLDDRGVIDAELEFFLRNLTLSFGGSHPRHLWRCDPVAWK